MNDKKPYKDTASFMDIVEDGWSREFKVEQTWNDLVDMGFTKILPSDIERIWSLMGYNFLIQKWKSRMLLQNEFGMIGKNLNDG